MEAPHKPGLFALVFAVFLGLSSAYGQRGDPEPRLEPELIRIGYSRTRLVDVNLEDVRVAVKLWAEEIASEWEESVSVEINFFDDLPALVRAIKAGDLDLFAVNSLDYLRIREEVPVEPCLLALMGGLILDEYILLVRRDRDLKGPADLSGLRLVTAPERFVNPLAMMWLETLLMKNNLGEKEHFFDAINTGSGTSQPVLAVFFRQADVGLVTRRLFGTMAELNPQLDEQLAILAVSPRLLHGFACFPENLDETKKQLIRDGAVNIHENPRGRQILTLFWTDKLIPFDPAYLDHVIALVEEYHGLKRKSGDKP